MNGLACTYRLLITRPEQVVAPINLNFQDRKNKLEEITDLESYLRGKMSIIESLEKMAAKVKNMRRSIWLIHEPPAYLGFGHCATGAKVGSPLVLNFISERQPLWQFYCGASCSLHLFKKPL